MSNKNQGRPENGGAYAGARSEQAAGLQERVAQVGDRVKGSYESARDQVSEGYNRAGELVGQHPGSSVLLGFGLGFGLGVALTLIFRPEQESWYDRYVPDRLRNLHVPDAISRHMPNR